MPIKVPGIRKGRYSKGSKRDVVATSLFDPLE